MSIKLAQLSWISATLAAVGGLSACAWAQSSDQDTVRPPRATPGTVPPRATPGVKPPRGTFMPPPMVQPPPRVTMPNSAPDPFGRAPRPQPRAPVVNPTPPSPPPPTPPGDPIIRPPQLAPGWSVLRRDVNKCDVGPIAFPGAKGDLSVTRSFGGGAFVVDQTGIAHGFNYGSDVFGYEFDYAYPCRPRPSDLAVVPQEGAYDPFVAGDQVEPAPLTPEKIQTLPVLERADLALRHNYLADAALLYREHIASHGETPDVVRMLGLSLLYQRNTAQAAALLLSAYENDVTLVSRPIDPAWLPGNRSTLRDRVSEAVRLAGRTKTPDGWLTAVVLMQAEGRPEVALRTLDRAKEAGLRQTVYEALRDALIAKPKR